MQIQRNMKLAEVIHLNYQLLPIISRFEIILGFGEKTIEQVCHDYTIDVDFFLEIINSFHNKDYFPKRHLQGFSIKLIVEYLQKSHNYYLKTKIPHIEQLLQQISNSFAGTESVTFKSVNHFFTEYKNELTDHIQREEIKVYPYVYAIEAAFLSRKPTRDTVAQIRDYSMDDFKEEHDNVEDKLYDLKNILIKYIPLPVDPQICQTILIELFRLETDLRDHARIEDKILVPKVKYMEKWILEHFTS